ncbi:MAG: septal ring lytic transglycosylase RlpA family protein [Phaeodactylibacter sp.]|nr:septal ring lytic transglycosylase RlpA family protein [Phaeodactylibacter sp.]
MKSFFRFLPLALFLFTTSFALAQEYGMASYYDDKFHGKLTASEEVYDKNKLTAAHNTLPYGTIIQVTRLDTKQTVRVRVNDRGPYIPGRIVDLSRAAAEKLNMLSDGTVRVKVEVVDKMTETTASTTTEKKKEEAAKSNPVTKAKEKKEEKASTAAKTTTKPTTSTASTSSNSSSSSSSSTGTSVPESQFELVTDKTYQQYDLYQISLGKPAKAGYGVQVYSLKNYESVFKQVAYLQGKWYKNILLSIEPGLDGQPIYKIILGPFDTREAAETYKKNIKKKNKIDGFVVDLSEQ